MQLGNASARPAIKAVISMAQAYNIAVSATRNLPL